MVLLPVVPGSYFYVKPELGVYIPRVAVAVVVVGSFSCYLLPKTEGRWTLLVHAFRGPSFEPCDIWLVDLGHILGSFGLVIQG